MEFQNSSDSLTLHLNGNGPDTAERPGLPQYGWKVPLDHTFSEKRNQTIRPRIKQIPQFVNLGIRYVWYYLKHRLRGKIPIMDFLNAETGKQIYGCPVGGIGAGTIGRGFRGQFCRFQLVPGIYEYNEVASDQFIVTIRENGRCLYQKVLSSQGKPKKCLSSWDWSFDGADAQYCALYPRAWTEYIIPQFNIRLVCRQVSPVIPNNYKDSSLPTCVFVWSIENNSDKTYEVSITFVFKNGTADIHDTDSCSSASFSLPANDTAVKVTGVKLQQNIRGMKCTYALASSVKSEEEKSVCTVTPYFNPSGSGGEFWYDLQCDGQLDHVNFDSDTPGDQIGIAVSQKCVVYPNDSKTVEFTLVWDMPKINFPGKRKEYYRRYTRFFNRSGSCAPEIAQYALSNYHLWEEAIEAWQNPILNDEDLPSWYKSALFNELYYVADGGTIWLEEDGKYPASDPRLTYGRFAYLEGHEYRMYNTYDVHFYASFALAMLWPKLQVCLQYDFADTILREDKKIVTELYNGKSMLRKTMCCIPHDLGDPNNDPFLLINAYCIHDSSDWKDLNSKFVLQVYRDYILTEDVDYLKYMWPKVKAIVEKSLQWDTDGDGLIENTGFPDQTYDSWVMSGASSYCGSLWIAVLYCVIDMCNVFNDKTLKTKYTKILNSAREAFEAKLWCGKYYKFDSSSSSNSYSIMSDQLCGNWYLQACGVQDEVFPKENVMTALKTIFDFNVMQFANGTKGAVNGMLPNGNIDITTIQSEEAWIGVIYGVAAQMIHAGLIKEGFKTAEGAYRTVYEEIGLGFETPEAIFKEKNYRAIGYMRPLSIWAMQHAWNMRKNELLNQRNN